MRHITKGIGNFQVKKMAVGRKNFFHLVHFRALLFILQARIFLKSCLFESMKKLKYFIVLTLFLSFFIPTSWAQQEKWLWTFEGGNFQITMGLQDDFSPVITSNGHLYFAVWYRKTKSGFDIYGTRIDKNGEIIDEEGIEICTAPNDQMFPSVASDGENFFVVWQDKRSGKRWDIYGTIVTNDGQVLEPFPIAVGKSTYDQVSPSLAFDGESYLVVWQGRKNAKLWNIYFTRLSKDGEALDEKSALLAPSLKDQASPSIGFNGENYFIVWQDLRNGKFWEIYGARVAPSGEVLDKQGNTISPTFLSDKENTYGWDKWRPVLSWDGEFFLVIWMTSQEGNKWFLEGKRVSTDGKPADLLDIPIQADTTNKIFPVILWDGDQYILIWEEEPEGESKICGASILPQFKPFEISETVQISSPDARDSYYSGISSIKDEILIIWQGKGEDDSWHIYGQRLKKDLEIPPVDSAKME